MSYALSLLDKSPIPEGLTGVDALRNTVTLARRAEQLGFHRFWLAEHHGSPLLASSAPEIIVAHILAQTSRIRVGTGGVMLQHYSPYKVAETFHVLESLAPGRVDLGIGKAPGGLPDSSRALQALHDSRNKPSFEEELAQLDAFLAGRALAGAVALPQVATIPERILLGGSPASAELAARHGWEFCHAGHFNGDPANIEATFRSYRDMTGRSPLLALYALAAASREKAEGLVGELRIFTAHLPGGQRVNLPTREAVAEFARQAGVTDYLVEEKRPHVIAGTAEDVRKELDALAVRFGVSEFIIDNPVSAFAARIGSIELLAGSASTLAA